MAIKALVWMVRSFPAPVYCYHEIVHNQLVVRRFEEQGVVFVDDKQENLDAAAALGMHTVLSNCSVETTRAGLAGLLPLSP